MTKKPLAPIEQSDIKMVEYGHIDISDLVWISQSEGPIPLKRMDDAHIRNVLLSLIGMGKSEYEDVEAKELWIKALRMEWEKRLKERRANFNR